MKGITRLQVRDARSRQMYRVDDEYVDAGYARVCKPSATAVYNSLCRHADSNQESWPSIERIMEQHGIGKNTVIRALKGLEQWNIITVIREKDPKSKRQMVNVYVLMDRSEWKSLPGSKMKPGPGAKSELGAGFQKSDEPGSKMDQKPGATTEPEGSTEEKDTQRRDVANATDPIETEHKCKYESCKKDSIKKATGEYLEMCKDHQPMTCVEFVEWYRKDSRRHINLIAELADETRPMFKTVIQWEIWASQHYKAAVKLQVFDDEQIEKAFKELKGATYITDFNLYTVLKFLTNSKKVV